MLGGREPCTNRVPARRGGLIDRLAVVPTGRSRIFAAAEPGARYRKLGDIRNRGAKLDLRPNPDIQWRPSFG